jgi:hypothetical protein
MLKGQKLLASRAATTQGVSFLLEVLAGFSTRHDTPGSQTPSPLSRHSSTLSGLTPYEYICKIWTSGPDRFTVDPIHQMPGLNT